MNNPVTETMEKVIKNAGKLALKLGGNQVATEHLLYGISSVKGCMASKILAEYGINTDNLLPLLEENSTQGMAMGVDVELTPRSKEIIGMAKQTASSLSHNFVGPEHLLYALLSNQNCFAVRFR